MTVKTLENQKIIADTISVSLSKKELELLIDKLSDMPLTNKQALNMYQKLAKKKSQNSTKTHFVYIYTHKF